jgi:hypothetical protein
MEPQQTAHGRIAAEFGNALIAGEFGRAYEMLSSGAKATRDEAVLRGEYLKMVEHFESPPNFVQVMEAMTEWPDKQPDDVGWAYAAIAGDGGSEAIIVIVASEGGKHLIRSVEWGRP